MRWSEVREGFKDAKETIESVNVIANDMARMLATDGLLRRVEDTNALRKLKTELRMFDMTTGKWRKPK